MCVGREKLCRPDTSFCLARLSRVRAGVPILLQGLSVIPAIRAPIELGEGAHSLPRRASGSANPISRPPAVKDARVVGPDRQQIKAKGTKNIMFSLSFNSTSGHSISLPLAISLAATATAVVKVPTREA